jgi:hypothetical protein
MSQSAPSDNSNFHPRSLTERLKVVVERLKEEADSEPPGEPSPGEPTSELSISGPVPAWWMSSPILAALIVVSLAPAVTIGAMSWQGVIRTPWSNNVVVGDGSRRLETQQTSIPSPAAGTLQPKQYVDALSFALTVPSTIEAEGGKEAPLSITLNSANSIPLRSIITIQGLPEGATLSNGRPYGEAEWTLRPDETMDLRLLLPKTASGHASLRIALVAADDTLIASATTQLNIVTDPKSALISRPKETELIAGLIAHGQKMIDVGYLAGARGYFRRAAEAGSADAALALGTTYDPNFINDAGVKGIKADLEEAQAWYERAQELGSAAAQEKLEDLKHALSVAAERVHGPDE